MNQRADTTKFQDRRSGSRHIWFLNSAFDKIDLGVALTRISDRDASKPFAFVVTPNVAWLTVCDSRVLELIGRFSGEKIDVSPGSDLTARLFETVIDPNETITIIGASGDVIDAVTARYGLTDVRWHEPPMGLRHNREALDDCARFVAENPARFIFMCVGSPQQELVAEACLDRGDCTGLGLCVGASLDFLGGKTERAPAWMQRSRLEWLHRLASEPRRMWRRYLVDGPKVFLLWQRWRKAQRELLALERSLSDPQKVRERALHQRIRALEGLLQAPKAD